MKTIKTTNGNMLVKTNPLAARVWQSKESVNFYASLNYGTGNEIVVGPFISEEEASKQIASLCS